MGSARQFSGAGALLGLHPPSSMSKTLARGPPQARKGLHLPPWLLRIHWPISDTAVAAMGFSGQSVSTPGPVPGLWVPNPRGPCFCTKASRQPLLCSQCFQSSGPAGHAFLWVHMVDGAGTCDLETPVPGDREAAHPSLWLRPEAPAPAPEWGSHGLLGSRLDSGHHSPDAAVPSATAPPAITAGLLPFAF